MTGAQPPVWAEPRLETDRQTAIELFRTERIQEPLDQYLEFYQAARDAAENLLEYTVDLQDILTLAPEVMVDEELVDIARYLASPPLSVDDLKTVSGVSLAAGLIRKDPERGRLLMSTILLGLDRERFPWYAENRAATPDERSTAVVATASMLAMRRMETFRRTEGKKVQEAALREYLTEVCGYTEVATRNISNLSQAPNPGEFCGECLVGSRLADVPVRLWDGRLMPVECKVSNSATNSVKRINNDAAAKAVTWRQEFGSANCVPAAVMSGCFSMTTLTSSQTAGLTLFWAHDLAGMRDFISRTRGTSTL